MWPSNCRRVQAPSPVWMTSSQRSPGTTRTAASTRIAASASETKRPSVSSSVMGRQYTREVEPGRMYGPGHGPGVGRHQILLKHRGNITEAFWQGSGQPTGIRARGPGGDIARWTGADVVELSAGDTTWVLLCAALVLFMTPGLAMFYGGMIRAKNILAMLMMNM